MAPSLTKTDVGKYITSPIRNALSAAIAVIVLSSSYAEAQPRSVRLDVGSDITNPIRTAVSTTISSDPQGRNPLTTKTIVIEINYKTPQGYLGSNGGGSNGYAGSMGTIVPLIYKGYTGNPGPTGFNGSQGIVGFTGSAGTTGSQGFTGSAGSLGYSGSMGVIGAQGQPGLPGVTGSMGSPGYSGSRGSTGFTGSLGLPGTVGFQGSRGITGYAGSLGVTGSLGSTGYVGSSRTSYNTLRVNGVTTIAPSVSNDTINFVPGIGISLTTTSSGITVTSTTTVPGSNNQILRSNGASGITSENNLSFNGQVLAVNGSITATGDVISSFSDDRLKIRQGNINEAVNKIQALNGFYYKINDLAQGLGHVSDRVHLGISAQEVQRVLPELVESAPMDQNYLTVNYERLVPVLIEAIKAQTLEMEQLEIQLLSLMKKVNQRDLT